MNQVKFNIHLYDTEVPISIIPNITFYDQLKIVHLFLMHIFYNKKSQKKQMFFKTLEKLKKKQFSEVFKESIIKNEMNYWKHNGICFINMNTELSSLFSEQDSPILKMLYNELLSKECDYFCVFTENSCLIFSLSSSHFLIWSLILKNIEYLFLAAILIENDLLSNINQYLRWKILEDSKKNLIKIFTNSSNEFNVTSNIHNFTNDSKSFLFMKSILNLQKEFLTNLSQNIENLSKFSTFHELEKLLFNMLNGEINSKNYFTKTNFIDTKSDLIVTNSSFKGKEILLLKLTPLSFLEIYPQIELEKNIKDSNSYYTPISLVETLVNYSLNHFFKNNQNYKILDLNIFDPAMGTGIILLFATEWLVNYYFKTQINMKIKYSYNDLRLKIIENCIYGNDLDIKAKNYFINFCKTFYIANNNLHNFNSNLISYNFLEEMILESKELLFERKYDIILSNPPYLALHSRFSKYPISNDKILLINKRIPFFSGKRDNFYLYFLGLCLTYLTKEDIGIVGFVIDASFLDLPSYSDVRRYLLDRYQVCYILSDFYYRNAVVDLSLIIIKNAPRLFQSINWQKSLYTDLLKINVNHFINNPNISFIFQKNSYLLTKIVKISIPLGEICKISCGLEYGSLLKTHFLSDTQSENFYPVLDGAECIPIRYFLFWTPNLPNSYVRFDKKYENWLIETKQNLSLNNKKVMLISGNIDRFLVPKIILRQTATKFIAVFDDKNFFLLRNLHMIYNPKMPYSIFFLLGIINSSLGSWIGERLNIIRKKGINRYPQIRLNDLKTFPMANLNNLDDKQTKSKILIEDIVKDLLMLSGEVSSSITYLWNSIAKTETKNIFKNKKHFIKVCIEKDSKKNSQFFERKRKYIETIKNIKKNVNKIKELRKLIDKEVFTLYKITKEEEKLISVID